jgi:hypothetical protein
VQEHEVISPDDVIDIEKVWCLTMLGDAADLFRTDFLKMRAPKSVKTSTKPVYLFLVQEVFVSSPGCEIRRFRPRAC